MSNADATRRFMDLLRGYASTQLLYVAARLDLGRLLADGPQDAIALGGRLSVDATTLRRVLRGLVNIGALVEQSDGFALTEMGRTLASPQLRSWAILTGELFYPARAGLLDAVELGRTPFADRFGSDFWTYLSAHEELALSFGHGMAKQTAAAAEMLASNYDFSRHACVVDVGGGHGQVLRAVLERFPECRGILQDRPEAAAEASRLFETSALSARARIVARSFFDEVVVGGDAYVLSWILHDWSDDDCVAILRNCRRAMVSADGAARLLILDSVMPERVESPTPIVDADLAMLMLTGGRERTISEFEDLLRSSGFRLLEASACAADRHLLVAAPS